MTMKAFIEGGARLRALDRAASRHRPSLRRMRTSAGGRRSARPGDAGAQGRAHRPRLRQCGRRRSRCSAATAISPRHGMEQFVRDARIAMIYEGANGIQALDLVGRKLGSERRPRGDGVLQRDRRLREGERRRRGAEASSPPPSGLRWATFSRRPCGSCRMRVDQARQCRRRR